MLVFELIVKALPENLDEVIGFVNEQLEEVGCAIKVEFAIDVAVEEIFVNIANYAYKETVGNAAIIVEFTDSPLTAIITFVDKGVPFDPLAKEDPDITLEVDDRKIGGLGIFMVKKSMDSVSYEYVDGENRLTLKKSLAV